MRCCGDFIVSQILRSLRFGKIEICSCGYAEMQGFPSKFLKITERFEISYSGVKRVVKSGNFLEKQF